MSLRITQTQRYNDCCPCFKLFWHFFVYTFNLVFSCKISSHRIGKSNYRFAPFRKFRNACSNLMNYSKVDKPMMLVIPCYLKLIAILKLLPVHWVSNIRGQHFTPVILISLAHAFDCKLIRKSDITFIASSFNVRLSSFDLS